MTYLSNRPRNYKAMGNVKLLQILREFQSKGDAYDRAMFNHTGDAVYEEGLAVAEARSRGYVDTDFVTHGIDTALLP